MVRIRDCVSRAYWKFAPGVRNLLVVADDFFIPLAFADVTEAALYDREVHWGDNPASFACSKYRNLGGVAIFDTRSEDKAVEYGMRVFANPEASSALPNSILNLRVG